MNILHINYADVGGGAEEFAYSLMKAQANSRMMVKSKTTSDERVIEFQKTTRQAIFSVLDKVLWKLGIKISFRSYFGCQNKHHNTYRNLKRFEVYRNADIIHLHNIHGEYFDLTAVKKIAKEKPVVWTPHDLWICTGGEGGIPIGPKDYNLRKVYPLKGGLFDERKSQLKLKKSIFSSLRNLYVVAPSNDHLNRIKITHPNIIVSRIYNGVDTDVFYSVSKQVNDNEFVAKVLIFNSHSFFKDTSFVVLTLEKLDVPFELHVIGEELSNSKIKSITNYGYINERVNLAKLFREMDIGVFSSRAETFGLLPAEFAACGGKVFLNQSLPVFAEHEKLYSATLFKSEEHLLALLKQYFALPKLLRNEGEISSRMIKENFNRADSCEAYFNLYKKILS